MTEQQFRKTHEFEIGENVAIILVLVILITTGLLIWKY